MTAWLVRLAPHPRAVPLDPASGLIDGHALYHDLARLVPGRFPTNSGAARGLLFRVEHGADGTTVLAQTHGPPRLANLDPELARATCRHDLAGRLAALTPGTPVRYRIAANPTRRNGSAAEPPRQDRLTVLRGRAAESWWLERAAAAGLAPLDVRTTPIDDIVGAHRIRHGVTRFDGRAVVTEPARLRAAVLTGIGRARNYGCGLLSIEPA